MFFALEVQSQTLIFFPSSGFEKVPTNIFLVNHNCYAIANHCDCYTPFENSEHFLSNVGHTLEKKFKTDLSGLFVNEFCKNDHDYFHVI